MAIRQIVKIYHSSCRLNTTRCMYRWIGSLSAAHLQFHPHPSRSAGGPSLSLCPRSPRAFYAPLRSGVRALQSSLSKKFRLWDTNNREHWGGKRRHTHIFFTACLHYFRDSSRETVYTHSDRGRSLCGVEIFILFPFFISFTWNLPLCCSIASIPWNSFLLGACSTVQWSN